jgi:hypothetical protein
VPLENAVSVSGRIASGEGDVWMKIKVGRGGGGNRILDIDCFLTSLTTTSGVRPVFGRGKNRLQIDLGWFSRPKPKKSRKSQFNGLGKDWLFAHQPVGGGKTLTVR